MIGPKYERPAKQTAKDERVAREVVGRRDGGVCVKCRRVHPIGGVSWDHRKNRSQGGLWLPSHGQLLCGTGTTGCHGWRTSRVEEAVAAGYAVPGWPRADPREWPARRWVNTPRGFVREAWVVYDDEGDWKEISEQDARERMFSMGWEGGDA